MPGPDPGAPEALTAGPRFDVAGTAYDRLIGRYGDSLAEALLAWAGAPAGGEALDVGCGPGALTAALARRRGAGRVAAAEPSEPFAAACRARVPGARVVVAPAEALPFPDRAFDLVGAQLVLNFLTDPAAGVAEMTRVARPGALVVACVWDYADGMTLLRAFWDAAREVLPAEGAAADEGVVMAPRSASELEALWRGAGLRDVRTGALVARSGYAGFGDLWSAFPAGAGPAAAFCARLPEADRGRLRDAMRRRLGAGDGPFALTARAWAVAGVSA